MTRSRRRRVLAILLAALAPIVLARTAHGASACEPWVDAGRVLVFGALPLGSPPATASALRQLPGCFASADGAVVDCEYADADGIAYLFDAQGLVRIEARRGEVSPTADLPLGLAPDASRATVRAALARIPSAALRSALERQADDGAEAWATPSCVRDARGEAGSWYVEFDGANQLRRIGIRLDVD